jgi:PTS system cellobiose-specific IIA component
MDESAKAFNMAHQQQTNLLFDEINGENTPVNVLLVHSQDHLMNAMTVREFAQLFIEQEKKIAALEQALKGE